MTPDRWRQVTGVFHAALARDTAARVAYLEEVCGGDPSLRADVEAMLAAHQSAGSFGEAPLPGVEAALNLEAGGSLGPYQIESLIGSGGMGQVYRARDPRIGRDVAIKVLPADYAADASRLRRFEQESRAIGALNHPNILTLYDVGTANGMPYLVMELLDGETLRDRLNRGALPYSKACDLAANVARGLSAAHAKGVVHRDLKPENIMITRDGRVKVLDFGIAKLRSTDEGGEDRTRTSLQTAPHVVLGTAGYMSPEQVRGLPADERADLFTLGAILHEVLTGHRAFDRGSSVETMNAILHDEPPPVNAAVSVPQVVQRIVERCLEKDPDARFQSARDLAFALETVPGTATTSTTAVAEGTSRRPLGTAVAAALALVAAVAAGTGVWILKPDAVPRAEMSPRFSIQQPARASIQGTPAISPDGRLLAYVSSAGPGTNVQLYVRRVDDFGPAPVPGTEGARWPFFSPDGRFLAFAANGKLKRVGVAADSSPVDICDSGLFLSGTWLPDNTIVFGSIEHGLQRVSAEGGTPTAVTAPDKSQSEIDHHYPKALPGGRVLLFTIHLEGNKFRIASYDLQTRTKKIVLESAFDPSYVSSGHLVYGTGQALLAAPFDANRVAITGPPIKLLDRLASVKEDGLANYGLSPTGTLAFHPDPDRSGRRLVWFDRAGKETPASTTTRIFEHPRVSPDGTQFAVAVLENDKEDIWIFDRRSNTFSQVTFDGANRAPLWTPDGSRLTYASSAGGKERLIWQPTDRGGVAESLFESPHNLWAIGWSASRRSLVYVDDPPTNNSELRVLDLEGPRRSAAIPEVPVRTVGSNVSADGQWVAFVLLKSGTGTPSINLRPLAGPGMRRELVQCGAAPVWSRDGRELFFLNQCANGANGVSGPALSALPFDPAKGTAAGPPVELFRVRPAARVIQGPASYDVAPDGRFLVILPSADELEPDHLNVILNVGDDLHRRLPNPR